MLDTGHHFLAERLSSGIRWGLITNELESPNI